MKNTAMLALLTREQWFVSQNGHTYENGFAPILTPMYKHFSFFPFEFIYCKLLVATLVWQNGGRQIRQGSSTRGI